jgi:hypothetical protein
MQLTSEFPTQYSTTIIELRETIEVRLKLVGLLPICAMVEVPIKNWKLSEQMVPWNQFVSA